MCKGWSSLPTTNVDIMVRVRAASSDGFGATRQRSVTGDRSHKGDAVCGSQALICGRRVFVPELGFAW